MWLIWKWRKTKDSFSEIKIEINQKVKIISSLKWTVLGKSGRSGVVELDSQKLMVDGRFCLSVHFLPTVHFYPIWPSTLNLMRFWNLKSPWATPHSGRSNRSSNRSGVSSSAERTRNQLSPSCGSIAPKRRKGSFWNSPRTRVSYVHSKGLIFWWICKKENLRPQTNFVLE